MIYELKEPSIAAHVFDDWVELDVGIIACLDNVMGKIFADDIEHPKSAMAVVGDFVYFAGKPNLELVHAKPDRWMIIVPQDKFWEELIENNFPAYKRIRYALRKNTKFNRKKLEEMINTRPEGYIFRKLDEELYDVCMADENFKDKVMV